jgi:hypothetical protein
MREFRLIFRQLIHELVQRFACRHASTSPLFIINPPLFVGEAADDLFTLSNGRATVGGQGVGSAVDGSTQGSPRDISFGTVKTEILTGPVAFAPVVMNGKHLWHPQNDSTLFAPSLMPMSDGKLLISAKAVMSNGSVTEMQRAAAILTGQLRFPTVRGL